MLHSYHFIYLKKKNLLMLAGCLQAFFSIFFFVIAFLIRNSVFSVVTYFALHSTTVCYEQCTFCASPISIYVLFSFFLFNSIVNGYIIFISMHIHLWMWDSIIHFYHLALNIRYSIFRISFAHFKWIQLNLMYKTEKSTVLYYIYHTHVYILILL